MVSGLSAEVFKAARGKKFRARRLSTDDPGGLEDDEADQFNDDTNLALDDDTDEYAVDDDKISTTRDVTHCDWNVALLRGGGVYDEMPVAGNVPAREWLPSGRLTQASNIATGLMEFTLQFPSPGSYTVTLECTFDDNTVVSFDDSVDAFYVRRELRDLKLEVSPSEGDILSRNQPKYARAMFQLDRTATPSWTPS